MNKHILFVIDHQLNPGKYTQKQLEENYKAAYAVAADAYNAAVYAVATYAVAVAANAVAAHAAYDVAFGTTADAAYGLNKYFKHTGENKQDYIDELESQS